MSVKMDSSAEFAAAMAEIEKLRSSADAWWSEYDRELKAHEATKAEVEGLRLAIGLIADHLWSISADEAHLDVVGDLRAALGVTVTDTPGERQCFISGCNGETGIDERGLIRTLDGREHPACVEHWEAIFGIVGRQQTWEREDASGATFTEGGADRG